jgi:hypothetical protein
MIEIMKKNLILLIAVCFSFAMTFTSCDEEVTDYKQGNLISVDEVFEITNTLFSFNADATYTTGFKLIPGLFTTTAKINVYKTFTDGETEAVSERVLAYSYEASGTDNSTFVEEVITYAELREGIIVNGAELPVDGEEVTDNSKWVLDVEVVDAANVVTIPTDATITITKNPYAGAYEVIYTEYWRINSNLAGDGTPLPDWVGEIRNIGALSPTLMSHPDWVGPFANDNWFFILELDNEIGEDTFNISIPIEIDGVPQFFGGTGPITCEDTPENFMSISSCESFLVVRENGEHELHLTYGYEFATGGASDGDREFREVLVKIVD